jgi:hypothetical protein
MNSLIIPPEGSKVPCIVVEDLESSAVGSGGEVTGTTTGSFEFFLNFYIISI